MFAKRFVYSGLLVLILGTLVLSAPVEVKAQDNSMCGYFRDDGYYYYTFYPYNGTPLPSPFSVDNFESTFGFRVDAGINWVVLNNPSFNRSGVLTGFGSYRRVSSCSTAVYTKPVSNTVLPLSNACSTKVALSIDKTNMAADWQRAIASARQTWAQAGSNLKFSSSAVTDAQRTLTPVDYEGNTITVNNQPLTLAPCEIRVFRATSMPGKYIVSLEKALTTATGRKQYTSNLAGWAQPFSRDGKYAEAVLVILNDRNANVLLSTHSSPGNLDVESIVLHEIGHALGLEHVYVKFTDLEKPVMMYPLDDIDQMILFTGILRRSLQPSDVKALVARFGAGPSSSTSSSANSSTSNSTGSSQPTKAQISNEVYFAALRKSAGYSNKPETDVLASIPAGSTVQIVGGSQKADGVTWWQVSWNGTTGWVADHTGSGKVILIFLP